MIGRSAIEIDRHRGRRHGSDRTAVAFFDADAGSAAVRHSAAGCALSQGGVYLPTRLHESIPDHRRRPPPPAPPTIGSLLTRAVSESNRSRECPWTPRAKRRAA